MFPKLLSNDKILNILDYKINEVKGYQSDVYFYKISQKHIIYSLYISCFFLQFPYKAFMTPSIWQLLIVLVIVLLLFGRGKIPQLMGDMAKGIKSFKRGMSDEEKKEDKNLENKNDEEK